MGGMCSMHERLEMHIGFCSENLKGRDLVLDRKILLKWILKDMEHHITYYCKTVCIIIHTFYAFYLYNVLYYAVEFVEKSNTNLYIF
jgi:hypothetical protein